MKKVVCAFMMLAHSISAAAQSATAPKPSARDLYVGCSLFVHETDVPKSANGYNQPYSASICALYGVLTIHDRERRVEGKDNKFRFCLPKTIEVSQNATWLMARAYIDFFESRSASLADKPGDSSFVAAMILKWPC